MKVSDVPAPGGAAGAMTEARSAAGPWDTDSGRTPTEGQPLLLRERIFGVVGGGMVLAAMVLLLTAALGREDTALIAAPPPLELIAPAPSDSIEGALELVFRTDARLQPQPGGWGVDGLHVHAEINGREIMPAASDISMRPDGAYTWTIGRAPAGEATVRLRWSDLDHRPLEEGATPVVRVHVR